MNSKLKTIVFGALVAGSLVMSAVPAMARDRDWYEGHRWDNRGWGYRGSQSNYEALEQARQKALYDASHHASRKKIAQDDAVVDQILNGMHHRR